MKNVSNIIGWTSVDESIHAEAGIFILNQIKKESPESVKGLLENLGTKLDEYISYESNLLDWIYEEGELDFFTKEDMMNFMKYRLDDSLVKLGQPKYFNVTDEEYSKMKWYEEEMYSTALDDFFAKRPVDYTKHDKSFDSDNLF